MPAEARWVRDGGYLGLGVGYAMDHASSRIRDSAIGFSAERNNGRGQAVGTAFLGYGLTVCCYMYYAAELGTSFPGREVKDAQADPGSTFERKAAFHDYATGDFLIGCRLTNCFLWYMRGGTSLAELHFRHRELTAFGREEAESKTTRLVGRIGAGINYGITPQFGIGIDFIYTAYNRIRFPSHGADTQLKASGRSNYIGLSGIYSF